VARCSREDLRAIARRPVPLGLLTTVLGYAAVFAVFTYIAPLLTEISGFDDSAVSPILLVFGGGLWPVIWAAGWLPRRSRPACRDDVAQVTRPLLAPVLSIGAEL
jgi:predicted MFS family arabinose efflux permease